MTDWLPLLEGASRRVLARKSAGAAITSEEVIRAFNEELMHQFGAATVHGGPGAAVTGAPSAASAASVAGMPVPGGGILPGPLAGHQKEVNMACDMLLKRFKLQPPSSAASNDVATASAPQSQQSAAGTAPRAAVYPGPGMDPQPGPWPGGFGPDLRVGPGFGPGAGPGTNLTGPGVSGYHPALAGVGYAPLPSVPQAQDAGYPQDFGSMYYPQAHGMPFSAGGTYPPTTIGYPAATATQLSTSGQPFSDSPAAAYYAAGERRGSSV